MTMSVSIQIAKPNSCSVWVLNAKWNHMANVGKLSCISSKNSYRIEQKLNYFSKRCIIKKSHLYTKRMKRCTYCLWGSLRTEESLFSLRHTINTLFLHPAHQSALSAIIFYHPYPHIAPLWFLGIIPHYSQSMEKSCPIVYSFQNNLGKALENSVSGNKKRSSS